VAQSPQVVQKKTFFKGFFFFKLFLGTRIVQFCHPRRKNFVIESKVFYLNVGKVFKNVFFRNKKNHPQNKPMETCLNDWLAQLKKYYSKLVVAQCPKNIKSIHFLEKFLFSSNCSIGDVGNSLDIYVKKIATISWKRSTYCAKATKKLS